MKKRRQGRESNQGHDTLGTFFRFATFREKISISTNIPSCAKNFRELFKNFFQTGKYSLSIVILLVFQKTKITKFSK